MRYVIVCFALFFGLPATAQQAPTGRRKHPMSRAFMEFKGDTCFRITRREADQAFRERCWDDAAALYRAAKSCADADQNGRSEMSRRIRACRDAAEAELLDKERAARRQARQAIASNRADDAQDLLKNFDRSLAYRLADFANQYIAPEEEDNADCLQAMFDAWYYIPREHLLPGFDSLRVPLCYQLPEDGANDGLLQFAGVDGAIRLYRFSPAKHLLYSWDARTLKPAKPLPVDTVFSDFLVSPNGRTVVFYGKGTFAFWQNGRELFRQKAERVKVFQFSPESDAFYYYDPEGKKIVSIDLRLKYVTQSRKSNAGVNVVKTPVPVAVIDGLGETPLTFDMRSATLWLGYADSIVVYGRTGDGKGWLPVRTVVFPQTIATPTIGRMSALRMFPEQEAALVMSEDSARFYRLPPAPGRYVAPVPQMIFPTQFLGIAADAALAAQIVPGNEEQGNHLYLLEPATGKVFYGSLMQPRDYFTAGEGVFSPDGRWFAVANSTGLVKLWALADGQSAGLVAYGADTIAKISPDGQTVVLQTAGKIESYPIPADRPAWSVHIPGGYLGELTVGEHWLAYFTGPDSLVVSRTDQTQTLVLRVDESRMPGNVALDPSGDYIAYATTPDSLVVRHLPDGKVTARRAFSGRLQSLTFLPGRHALAVVLMLNDNDLAMQQNVIKIWDFDTPAAALSTMRLHEYNARMIAVSPSSNYIAISDGTTVRIFDLDKPDDEQSSIRAFQKHPINTLVFRPDGQTLAVGYTNGVVVFWQASNAHFVFELKSAYRSWTDEIMQMAFSPTGNYLRYLDFDNNLFERQLDPDTIRATAQTPDKQLIAFTPDQILQYDLEPALSYDQNFEALANSNDAPLIQSFFEFYREQAINSNNIEQVGIYCQRAYELYKHLDPNFQVNQRQIMVALYEDYSWKWLLRDKIAQSARVVADMQRNFDAPLEALRAGAFTALLDNDLPAASRLFVNWMMAVQSSGTADFEQSELLKKLAQLLDYDLLHSDQISYLCALFGSLAPLDERMCPAGVPPVAIPFDPDTQLRWKILVALYQANLDNYHARSIKRLESALKDAQTLARRHPESRLELERTVVALANRYFLEADFEQNSSRTPDLYRRAVQLLRSAGKFRNEHDQQELLARIYLALGDFLITTNQLPEAIAAYTQGLTSAASPALGPADAGLPAGLYGQRALGYLLAGDDEAARSDLETETDKADGIVNSFYAGPAAWLEGRSEEALGQYASVSFDEQSLALARFVIGRLIELRPDRRDRMTTFDSVLYAAVRVQYPGLDTLQAAYQLAYLRHRHYAALGQWTKALNENEKALRYTERGMKRTHDWTVWPEYWLATLVTESYYLLFVSAQDPTALPRSIQFAEQAQAYVTDSLPAYIDAMLVKTNHAHALLLRDAPGDRARALVLYHDFLDNYAGSGNGWELLQKDFRDLHAAGVQWPRLREVIEAIKPADVELSAEDWQAMGVVQ